MQAVLDCLAPDASWQNVPHPPSVGRANIAKLFGGILPSCEKVRWDVESISYGPEEDGRALVWAERIDRFWIGGAEYAVRCNGVFEFDLASGLIIEVRDYVDLGEWRSRLAAADLRTPAAGGAGAGAAAAGGGSSAAGVSSSAAAASSSGSAGGAGVSTSAAAASPSAVRSSGASSQ